MARCRCEEEVTTTAAERFAAGGAPLFLTGRQYIGNVGFDSPFDVPTPVLTLKPEPAVQAQRMMPRPWLLLAVVAAGIAYFYLERRR